MLSGYWHRWIDFSLKWLKATQQTKGQDLCSRNPKTKSSFSEKILLLWKEETAWWCRNKARDPWLGATFHSARLELIAKTVLRITEAINYWKVLLEFSFLLSIAHSSPYFTIIVYLALFQQSSLSFT